LVETIFSLGQPIQLKNVVIVLTADSAIQTRLLIFPNFYPNMIDAGAYLLGHFSAISYYFGK
jgi:hypothetical protein